MVLLNEKTVKDKALELTSIEFETELAYPENYGKTAGNFDGQGISHGCIQFPLGWGTLQGIWKDLYNNYPTIVRNCFGTQADFDEWHTWLYTYTIDQQINHADLEWTAWEYDANGNRIQASGHNVKLPWKTYFRDLGVTAESILRQQEEVENPYHINARTWFNDFALWTRRGYALMFDISVQNGSINPIKNGVEVDVFGRIFTRFAALNTAGLTPEQIETEKMKIIVDERAKEVSETWRFSYTERKRSIAEGSLYVSSWGKWVYTEPYNLILEEAFAGFTKSDLYVAQEGDTFASIAAKYNTTEAKIDALNPRVSPTNIYAGLSINVPYQQASKGIYIGTTEITKAFLGATQLDRIYLGLTEIFTKPAVVPITTISPSATIQNNIPITVTLTTNETGATIYYRLGIAETVYTYTAPFTVNQTSAGVGSTNITVTYWAVGAAATETQKSITYDTSGAVPAQPVVTATAGDNQVTLSWAATANTTSYTVYRSTTSGTIGTILSQYQSALTYTDTTAVNGTTYYYTVRANNYGNVTDSVQKAATPAAPAATGYRYIRQWQNGGNANGTITNYNTMLEFQAITTGGTNLLLNKANLEGWTGKLAGTTNPASNITDGITADMWNYAIWSDSTAARTPQKITYDMGSLRTDLATVKTWHNYASTGRYYNFKIQVCATNSANDADWITVIDLMTNETTKTHQETSAGFTFNVPY